MHSKGETEDIVIQYNVSLSLTLYKSIYFFITKQLKYSIFCVELPLQNDFLIWPQEVTLALVSELFCNMSQRERHL